MRIGPLEELDVARYDAFLDHHEDAFKALRALLEGPPSGKALRKVLSALRAWPEDQDREGIVIPYAAYWLRRWRATLSIDAQDFTGFWYDLCAPERAGLLGLVDQLTIDQQRRASAWTTARLDHLVSPPRLRRLEVFTLRRCATLSETQLLDRLLSHEALPALQTLSLQRCELKTRDVARLLAGATVPGQLRELHITHTALAVEALAMLFSHPVMAQVERLGMTHCALNDDAILVMTRSPMLRQLRVLQLEGNQGLTRVSGELLDRASEALPRLEQPRHLWRGGKPEPWASYLESLPH